MSNTNNPTTCYVLISMTSTHVMPSPTNLLKERRKSNDILSGVFRALSDKQARSTLEMFKFTRLSPNVECFFEIIDTSSKIVLSESLPLYSIEHLQNLSFPIPATSYVLCIPFASYSKHWAFPADLTPFITLT
jgi:hypothetical protein